MSARDRETLDLFTEETYSVSQIGQELASLLREAYASVWVAGEVQRLRVHPSGHCYLELVEKGEGDAIIGRLDAVIWRGDLARIRTALARHGQRLGEGLTIRCRVTLDFYPPHGKLQVHVKEVDPVFALGQLEARRRETLAALAAAGLLEANRLLPFPVLPLEVGLVASVGSAAYHDFLSTLAESGYGFRVTVVHAPVQGREAESGVASALELLAATTVECVALVRGGGARSDLAAFDSRAIAFAVASSALPVLTGLGHEIDESVADRVAHAAFKTPTKVAEHLVAAMRAAELSAERSRQRLRAAARLPLAGAASALADAERRFAGARARLARTGARIEALARALAATAPIALRGARAQERDVGLRLVHAAPRALARAERDRRVRAAKVVASARALLAMERVRLEGRGRVVAGFSPARTLGRGFSITRDAAGRILRRPEEVRPGDRLTTELANGRVASRVEET